VTGPSIRTAERRGPSNYRKNGLSAHFEIAKPTASTLVVGYAVAVVSVVVAFVAARAFLYFHLPLAIMSFCFCAIAIKFW
jgi:hypothetical protein